MATMALGLSNRQHMTAIHNDITSQISELRDHAATSAADSAVKAPWLNKEDAAELRQIHRGDIQAYTATADKTGQKNKLPACLHAVVMNAILANPTPWKKRLLPPGYGKNPKQSHTKAFGSLVNVVLKEVRKEFEGSLLENIHLPNRTGPTDEEAVPTIESLYVKLKEKEAESKVGRVVVREEIVANFKHQEEARLAYLRMQACHWGFYKSEYSDKSFWCVVDDQLEVLRKQSRRYRYAFAIICLAEDYDLFKGKKTLAELRPLTSFPVPDDEWIRKVMSELDETWGDDVPELEALHE
ncbi:uncharacterized protein MELLADRAFT_88450 [Melampsora larici-populina 98AG31]|nr:uncharacterized protein MELLADRAFT_88450 [Melampsora larici-populina 98AG31]EGG04732.1 hypothetical protein MELLADRAFT_88450 [Melampsora larici-populina 98AG31]